MSTSARSRRSLLSGRAPAPDGAVISISAQCLLARGVVCQACTDVCDARALRYRMLAGSAGRVEIDADACTACGECLDTCPAAAMSLALPATIDPVTAA